MRLLLLALGLLLSMTLHAQIPAQVRVILVGDSTMAPDSGYGDALCARFTPDIVCINRAKGGRSSKSYRVEGSWDEVVRLLAANKDYRQTYVLIQFGHNDQPGKGERSTSLPEFAANMSRYVQEVRAAGATPVVVTPLTRRQFKQGKVVRDLDDWALATRAVASKTGAPLLDLNADSVAAVEKLGPTAANSLAQAEPPADVAAAALTGTTIPAPKPEAATVYFDYTHLGPKGAGLFATIVADEIRAAVPELSKHFSDR